MNPVDQAKLEEARSVKTCFLEGLYFWDETDRIGGVWNIQPLRGDTETITFKK